MEITTWFAEIIEGLPVLDPDDPSGEEVDEVFPLDRSCDGSPPGGPGGVDGPAARPFRERGSRSVNRSLDPDWTAKG